MGRYRLVCVGQIVFELWGKLPKPVKEKAKRGIKLKLRPYLLRKKNPRNLGQAGRFRCCKFYLLALAPQALDKETEPYRGLLEV